MALVPGLVAVLRIVPASNKVALGETVWRVPSASSTPRIVFGGGDARRKLVRRASRWTREVWGLFLASLAVWPSCQPGARYLSSSLAPPQDRENCHAGGNVFANWCTMRCRNNYILSLQGCSLVGEGRRATDEWWKKSRGDLRYGGAYALMLAKGK